MHTYTVSHFLTLQITMLINCQSYSNTNSSKQTYKLRYLCLCTFSCFSIILFCSLLQFFVLITAERWNLFWINGTNHHCYLKMRNCNILQCPRRSLDGLFPSRFQTKTSYVFISTHANSTYRPYYLSRFILIIYSPNYETYYAPYSPINTLFYIFKLKAISTNVCFFDVFDILLTVHITKILLIDKLNAQILLYNKFIIFL